MNANPNDPVVDNYLNTVFDPIDRFLMQWGIALTIVFVHRFVTHLDVPSWEGSIPTTFMVLSSFLGHSCIMSLGGVFSLYGVVQFIYDIVHCFSKIFHSLS